MSSFPSPTYAGLGPVLCFGKRALCTFAWFLLSGRAVPVAMRGLLLVHRLDPVYKPFSVVFLLPGDCSLWTQILWELKGTEVTISLFSKSVSRFLFCK